MNYLAHAYLSFGHPQLLVGNMISDFVKGKSQYDYERQIGAGIQLHRAIDNFTDTHTATATAKEIFRPHYRLYSGALVDVLYDHFLANDTACFTSDINLFQFSQEVYSTLGKASSVLPPRFQQLLPYMQSQNWLYYYKDREGIQKSLQGVVRRATYLSDAETAFRLFEKHYDHLQDCYDNFIGDVKSFARAQVAQLL